MQQRTVALDDLILRKARRLKLTIHVGREDEMPQWLGLRPAQKNCKSIMRDRCAIEVPAMSVEAPGQVRITAKPGGVRHLLEAKSFRPKSGIVSPEPFRAAKVGQAGINPHARARGDQQRVGRADRLNCLCDCL